jgi:DNA-binding FadR family transcriptional regulator
MYNAFRAAYEPALAALATATPAETKRPDAYRKLADAVCAGDPAGAKITAQELLEFANTTLMAALDSSGNQR